MATCTSQKSETKGLQPLSTLQIWNGCCEEDATVFQRPYSKMVNHFWCYKSQNTDVNSCLGVWNFCQDWCFARVYGFSAMWQTDLGTWELFGVERPLEAVWLAGLCPARPASKRLRDHRLGRQRQRLLCLLWQCYASPQQHCLLLNGCKTPSWQQ